MELNPFDHAFHEDPYRVYAWLRENEPCYHNRELDFFALSRYHDVAAGLQDPAAYSSTEGTTIERVDTGALLPMLVFMDPPRHNIIRRLVGRAFTTRTVSDLEPAIRRLAVDLLDPLADSAGGDFVSQFSALLPSQVILELLGVPPEDRKMLTRLMDRALTRNQEPPFISDDAMEAIVTSLDYWQSLVADKRANPDDGLVSRLCAAEFDDEEGNRSRLSDVEVVGFCFLLGSAGTDGVMKVLANAVVLLHRHPGQWERILLDADAIPGAFEETVRYWPPSQFQGRVLTRDVALHGVTMPQGSRVLLLTGSANHDEREFPNPDDFDIGRRARSALGFGQGAHFCLGASLARLEGRVALQEFATRFPKYEVDEAGLTRVHMSNSHGFASVPFARL